MTARDLFTDTPREETPAADVQHRQSSTGRTPDRQAQGPITPVGASRDDSVASRARCCGDCGAGTANKHGFVRCEHGPSWQWLSRRLACQFEPVRWVPVSPAVLAKREAQAGIDQAVAAAERQIEGWTDTAYAFISLWCAQNKGARCIGHDIVQASIAKGVIQPSNAKAWGGPIQRAAREGLIKRIGFDEDPNRHGNPVPLWEVA